MKTYSKNQLFFITVALPFFAYWTFLYFQNQTLLKSGNKKECLITDISCHEAASMKSTLSLSYNHKIYVMDLTTNDCYKYTVGQREKFLYNVKNDSFLHLNYLGASRNKALISGLFLLIALIPWSLFQKKK